MIRRFNYTDRVKISRDDIAISLNEQNGQIWFDADLVKLEKYKLPPDSLVFLEAYRLSNWMRFDFGRIAKLSPPSNLHLKIFDSSEGVKFRVKITAVGDTHKLLAVAEAIPLTTPDSDEGKNEPLLPVIPSKELGDEIYRVNFAVDRPVLLINSDVGNYKEVGRSSAFLSLALPAILREILTQIIFIEKTIHDDDMDDWRCRWIKFIKQYPGVGEMPMIDDSEECLEWIQTAVSVFSKKQKLKTQFLDFWRDTL